MYQELLALADFALHLFYLAIGTGFVLMLLNGPMKSPQEKSAIKAEADRAREAREVWRKEYEERKAFEAEYPKLRRTSVWSDLGIMAWVWTFITAGSFAINLFFGIACLLFVAYIWREAAKKNAEDNVTRQRIIDSLR